MALFSTECSCEFLPAPALADTIYQVTASDAFDSGAEVRAFDSTGRNETDVSLAGSTLSVTFDYDLNEAPADSFTPGSSSNSNLDSNSYVRNASPIFVSGTVTLGTQLDIPGALPIPSSFNLTATPGATDSNIAQTLRFTQAPGGLSSVLGTWSLSESFASGNTNYGYNWNIGFLCGSVTQIVPLGNYGASAPPPFHCDSAGQTQTGVVNIADAAFVPGSFSMDFALGGDVQFTSIAGQVLTPEPDTFALLGIALVLGVQFVRRNERRRFRAETNTNRRIPSK